MKQRWWAVSVVSGIVAGLLSVGGMGCGGGNVAEVVPSAKDQRALASGNNHQGVDRHTSNAISGIQEVSDGNSGMNDEFKTVSRFRGRRGRDGKDRSRKDAINKRRFIAAFVRNLPRSLSPSFHADEVPVIREGAQQRQDRKFTHVAYWVGEGQIHWHYHYTYPGWRYEVRVLPESGDPDLYVWVPEKNIVLASYQGFDYPWIWSALPGLNQDFVTFVPGSNYPYQEPGDTGRQVRYYFVYGYNASRYRLQVTESPVIREASRVNQP